MNIYKYLPYTGELIGIEGTYVYHRDNCKFIQQASADDLIFFNNLEDAAEADYRPCKSCTPPDDSDQIKEEAVQKNENEKALLEEYANKIRNGEYVTLLFDEYKALIKIHPELKDKIDEMNNKYLGSK